MTAVLWALAGAIALAMAYVTWRADRDAAAAMARAAAAEATVAAQAAELKRMAHTERLLAERAKLLAREVRADDRYETRVWSGAKPSPVMWRPGREVTPYEG